jgi:ribonuclease-3
MKHEFADPSLLELALTHSSWAHEYGGEHNERMEFLGDAVLQACTTEVLYSHFPDEREGVLHRYRSQLVKNAHLAELARKWDLPTQVRLGPGEETSGGRDKDRLLAGAFEAVLAAIFLDGGFPAAREEIQAVLRPDLDDLTLGRPRDVRQILDEWCKTTHGDTADFEVVRTEGPDHNPTFYVVVRVEGEPVGEGSGSSKRLACRAAAEAAVLVLGVKS